MVVFHTSLVPSNTTKEQYQQKNDDKLFSETVHRRNELRSASQPAITCSKLTISTLEQGVKYGQS